jgi:UDPglucose 6-dehydrogenase
MAQIATMGLWHLGCVVSAGLASLGHTVRGTDPNSELIRNLQQTKPPVYEPGLPEMMTEQAENGRLMFVESADEALAGADFVFLTFDTPVDDNDSSDLTLIEASLEQIAKHARQDAAIVVMSQVPVGSCDLFSERLHHLAPRASFIVVYQPENLRLGQALSTFLQPDFLVFGAEDRDAAQNVLRLYEGIETKKLVMSRNSAEMTKHVLNAFLATSISFVNEMADLAEVCSADIRDVVSALRLDRRIGPHAFLSPGPGFSGGTLGRDLQTLRHLGARRDKKTLQLDATLAVNDLRISNMIKKLERECGSLSGMRVGLLGLTYKPGTSTLRRSRALEVARMLLSAGASVRAFDPMVTENQKEMQGIVVCADAYQAVAKADCAIVMTPWPEFRHLDLHRLREVMHRPVLMDAHNYLDAGAARAAGIRYCGVGIPKMTEARKEVALGANP